jgi:hypothetical protein
MVRVGALYNPTVIVSHSTISSNREAGIEVDYAGVRVTYSTISGNGSSGVLLCGGAVATIGKSVISGGWAAFGKV